MHIPDGYLSLDIVVGTFIVTAIVWVISFKKVKITEQQVPIMGLLTAFFFAAMLVNFPLVGPTTAHLLGGASIGLILGPFAGVISMTIILVLQAFLFGDGGLTTLGANVLNVGILAVFIPCILFLVMNKLLKPKTNGTLYAMIFVSAFVGDLLSAIVAGTEVGLSTLSPWYGIGVAVPVMAINHSIIGVAEGIVTVVLIGTLLKLRPDVLEKSPILGKLPIFKNKPAEEAQ